MHELIVLPSAAVSATAAASGRQKRVAPHTWVLRYLLQTGHRLLLFPPHMHHRTPHRAIPPSLDSDNDSGTRRQYKYVRITTTA